MSLVNIIGSELMLANELARASMELAETLKFVYELCDDAFCQGTFIQEWIYDLSNHLV